MHLLLSSSPNWYLSHVLAATADGSIAAYAGHLSVTVLCCRQQQILRCLWPQRIRVCCITFAAADTLLVAGYEDGSARCFDWSSGECVCSRAAQKSKRRQASSELTAVIAPPWLADTAVFADAGGQLLLWPFTGGRTTKFSVLLEGCGSKVTCLAAAPQAENTQQGLHQVVAGCQDGTCLLVDVAAGCQLARWKAHAAAVQCILWCHAPTYSSNSNSNSSMLPEQPLLEAGELCDLQPGPSSSSSTGDAVDAAVIAQPANAGFLVSAGGDRQVKLWELPLLGTKQHQPPASTSEAVSTSTTGAAAVAAAASQDATTPPSDQGGEEVAVTAATPAAAGGKASAAAASPSQVLLQLRPLSAAAVDPSPPAAGGPKAPQFYGAAAVLPGSVATDGSCVVVCAGVNGRLGQVALRPGDLNCRWTVLNKSPHTGGVFQLLLLLKPGQASSSQPTALQEQQQQQEPANGQQEPSAGQKDSDHHHHQQQQQHKGSQQHRQHNVGQQASKTGGLQLLSVAMDRCFALSKLTPHTQPTAPHAAAAPEASGNSAALSPDPVTCPTPSSPSSSSSSRSSSRKGASSVDGPLAIKQCGPVWVCQGLGGFAYSCAVQQTFADGAVCYPRYSKVRAAVSCGDKTLRVITLGVRATPLPSQQQQQQQQQETLSPRPTQQQQQSLLQRAPQGQESSVPSTAAEAGAAVAGVACGAAASVLNEQAATDATAQQATHGSSSDNDISSSTAAAMSSTGPEVAAGSCSSSSSNDGAVGVAAGSSEQQAVCNLQLPVPKPTLLWKYIQDRAQAIAWHPTNPRLLAFGCHDGVLGVYDVASSQAAVYSKRHGGPVTHLAWLHSQQQQQQQQQPGTDVSLLSVGGEGCLLCWPAISPSSNSSRAQPVDIGTQLQLMAQAPGQAQVRPAGPTGTQGPKALSGQSTAVHWSSLAVSSCGSHLAVCSTRGETFTLSSRQGSGSEHNVGAGSSRSSRGVGGSGGDSWRSSSRAAAGGGVLGQWQLMSCHTTPTALPLTAAAWQPSPGELPAAAAGAAGGGVGLPAAVLLAAVDEANLYVLPGALDSSSSSSIAQCVVPTGAQQLRQQQLLAVAWSAPDVVCVGCSDGSIQVVKVCTAATSGPHDIAAAGTHTSDITSSSSCAISQSVPVRSVVLQPLHSLKGHSGPVLTVAALPGWPGLLLSGSQDQTLRCWQPLLEAPVAPAGLQGAAAAAAQQQEQQQQQEQEGGTSSQHTGAAPSTGADAKDDVAVSVAGAADAAQIMLPAGVASTAVPAAQPIAADQQLTHGAAQPAAAGAGAATATPAAAGAVKAVGKASKKAARLFICPKAKPFLPELPDTSNPVVQQQALLDVVALAEALYPPAGTLNPDAAEPCGETTMGLNPEVLALLGVQAPAAAAADNGCSGGQQEQQQQQQRCTGPCGALEPSVPAGQQAGGAHASLGVAAAFHEELSGVVGQAYPVGSWLPVMTADVPELLQQHQQWMEQRQHNQQQPVVQAGRRSVAVPQAPAPDNNTRLDGICATSVLSDSQLGMLRFVSGDVRGFLKDAVGAACVTPDVVALSAAGGLPAFRAAARLAAVKLAAADEREAAALHFLAVGDAAAAAEALQ